MKTHFKWLNLSLLIIFIDQFTKYWAEHVLQHRVVKIFSWFDFSLAHNRGAAFGFLNQAGGWQHVFFISLALVVSIVLLVLIKQLKTHQRHLAIAYSLILAGAIGNVIDRVIYQYVIDFIHWFYKDWHYPHFNVADMVICCGAVLLVFDAFEKPFLDTHSKELQK